MDTLSGITVTERQLTADEMNLVKQGRRVPILSIVYFIVFMGGIALVLVPGVLGGLIFALIKLCGFKEQTAGIIGLSAGGMVGLVFLVVFGGSCMRWYLAGNKALLKDEEYGMSQELKIEKIRRAWWVYGNADGPADYLLEAGTGTYLYIRTDDLLDNGVDDNLDFPGDSITVTRLPYSKQLLNLEVKGQPIESDGVGLKEFGEIELLECMVFPRDVKLPETLLQQLKQPRLPVR